MILQGGQGGMGAWEKGIVMEQGFFSKGIGGGLAGGIPQRRTGDGGIFRQNRPGVMRPDITNALPDFPGGLTGKAAKEINGDIVGFITCFPQIRRRLLEMDIFHLSSQGPLSISIRRFQPESEGTETGPEEKCSYIWSYLG